MTQIAEVINDNDKLVLTVRITLSLNEARESWLGWCHRVRSGDAFGEPREPPTFDEWLTEHINEYVDELGAIYAYEHENELLSVKRPD